MNLEIPTPEHFHDAEELHERAVDALEGKDAPPLPSAEPKSPVDLLAALRGHFTDEEVDTLFSRNRSTARPLDLT